MKDFVVVFFYKNGDQLFVRTRSCFGKRCRSNLVGVGSILELVLTHGGGWVDHFLVS